MRVPSLETRVVRVTSTDGFSRYVAVPSTWQWLRLAWTFRNFSQLPETVLSTGQRHMLSRLCGNGIGDLHVNHSNVIGTFELHRDSFETLFANSTTSRPTRKARQAKKLQPPVRRPSETLADPAPAHRALVKDLPYAEFRKRSGHRTAAAICVLLLVGSTYAWQRLAQAGYVRPPVSATGLADLTQPAVAAARPSSQVQPTARVVTPAEEPAPNPQTVEPTQSPAAEAPSTPAPTVQPLPAAEPRPVPVKVTELNPAATPARELAHVVKAPEQPTEELTTDSLRQDARPKSLIYPPAGSRTGKVVLGLTVGADGAVEKVQVVSGDRALAKSAASTVKQWHYSVAGADQFKSVVTVTFMGDDAVMVRFPTQAELGK